MNVFQTVPFDLMWVHPSPRQAKAMVSSSLLAFLLPLLFFSPSPFLLQTPPHLSLNLCHLSPSVSHLLNIPVQVQHPDDQHLQTQILPLLTHPPAVPALASLQRIRHIPNKNNSFVHTFVEVQYFFFVTWSRQSHPGLMFFFFSQLPPFLGFMW